MGNRSLALAVSLLVAGCGLFRGKESQLEKIAKDWCLAIRASQVMPVYPLTQDLQPGDVFLVEVPVEKQQEIWDRKGYLPLDHHVGRLQPSAFAEFYSHSFLRPRPPPNDKPQLPFEWLAEKWEKAPRAGFPTYTFSVSRSAGLSVAVPVSGVP